MPEAAEASNDKDVFAACPCGTTLFIGFAADPPPRCRRDLVIKQRC